MMNMGPTLPDGWKRVARKSKVSNTLQIYYLLPSGEQFTNFKQIEKYFLLNQINDYQATNFDFSPLSNIPYLLENELPIVEQNNSVVDYNMETVIKKQLDRNMMSTNNNNNNNNDNSTFNYLNNFDLLKENTQFIEDTLVKPKLGSKRKCETVSTNEDNKRVLQECLIIDLDDFVFNIGKERRESVLIENIKVEPEDDEPVKQLPPEFDVTEFVTGLTQQLSNKSSRTETKPRRGRKTCITKEKLSKEEAMFNTLYKGLDVGVPREEPQTFYDDGKEHQTPEFVRWNYRDEIRDEIISKRNANINYSLAFDYIKQREVDNHSESTETAMSENMFEYEETVTTEEYIPVSIGESVSKIEVSLYEEEVPQEGETLTTEEYIPVCIGVSVSKIEVSLYEEEVSQEGKTITTEEYIPVSNEESVPVALYQEEIAQNEETVTTEEYIPVSNGESVPVALYQEEIAQNEETVTTEEYIPVSIGESVPVALYQGDIPETATTEVYVPACFGESVPRALYQEETPQDILKNNIFHEPMITDQVEPDESTIAQQPIIEHSKEYKAVDLTIPRVPVVKDEVTATKKQYQVKYLTSSNEPNTVPNVIKSLDTTTKSNPESIIIVRLCSEEKTIKPVSMDQKDYQSKDLTELRNPNDVSCQYQALNKILEKLHVKNDKLLNEILSHIDGVSISN